MDDPTDAEPVLPASVQLDGPDIDEEYRMPPELLVPGTEIHAKVRCGQLPRLPASSTASGSSSTRRSCSSSRNRKCSEATSLP